MQNIIIHCKMLFQINIETKYSLKEFMLLLIILFLNFYISKIVILFECAKTQLNMYLVKKTTYCNYFAELNEYY